MYGIGAYPLYENLQTRILAIKKVNLNLVEFKSMINHFHCYFVDISKTYNSNQKDLIYIPLQSYNISYSKKKCHSMEIITMIRLIDKNDL